MAVAEQSFSTIVTSRQYESLESKVALKVLSLKLRSFAISLPSPAGSAANSSRS